ncbi:hypothetical protein [Nonomuraea sp. NPDC049400]|uniref:hypothetical protein n=1 Tax=Nonomuraea sp. NPDC049400 TaxID=3364352 RepID=UPI0037956804
MLELTYASAAGHAFINQRLYLPESWAGDADRRAVAGVPQQVRLLAQANPAVWEGRSCGQGSNGARVYDWATLSVTLAEQRPADGHAHTILIRRSVSDPNEVELFLAHARIGTPITELISVAGLRWKIEENNETGKDLLGLTHYQVRKWDGWHRHVTTAMLALGFLSVTHSHLDDEPASVQGMAHPAQENPHWSGPGRSALSRRDPPSVRPPHPAPPLTSSITSCLVPLPATPPDTSPDQPLPPTRRPAPSKFTDVLPAATRADSAEHRRDPPFIQPFIQRDRPRRSRHWPGASLVGMAARVPSGRTRPPLSPTTSAPDLRIDLAPMPFSLASRWFVKVHRACGC